ncbi:HlyD family secretion protein [Lihuaxuella thermophila]|uniref:HlyD membrane-fusion protein of T1SS n=1 Tax=Lihuaxuella thermophila TaxID=1173111 RepID=A0A1H8J2E6_9BACL|nr:HlyD family efflux transporter periplasmic adaptor subunit [Lihuaxuella thermophila]SEN74851.1 HlyD membrane-fusion protein of T1SS [Lihuaxuella thermophila]
MKRLMISVTALACILALVGGGVYSWNQHSQYLTTDNARVEADIIPITAPATGKLSEWSVHVGEQIGAHALLGKEEVSVNGLPMRPGSKKPGQEKGKPVVHELLSPIEGVILETHAVPGEVVRQGETIAMAADLSNPYVLAYIDEEQILDISTGKEADIFLDAYPDETFHGKVTEIGRSAGNFLSGNASASDSKEIERVPVKIVVDDFSGKYLALGMNATIKIHK